MSKGKAWNTYTIEVSFPTSQNFGELAQFGEKVHIWNNGKNINCVGVPGIWVSNFIDLVPISFLVITVFSEQGE